MKENYRLIFEENYGSRISDATWYRLRKLFNSTDFKYTKVNVIWLAGLKKQLPRCEIRLASIIQGINEVTERLTQSRSTISGKELLELLEQYDISVHPNTLTKWFKPIYGFRRTRIYESKQLKPILMAAFAYKLRQTQENSISNLVQIA